MKIGNFKRPKFSLAYLMMFGVFILLIPSMLKGIDLTDMAYMLTKYKYVFDRNVPVNGTSIILTEILGGLLYHAVPEGQVLLLTLACWGLNCGIALLSFRLLQEYLNGFLLAAILLGGSFFSIAFIHIAHYDTFSMFFQVLAFFLLIKGMDEQRRRWILISGFILGLNVFVRLPNILQTSFLILIVWYFGGSLKSIKKIVWDYMMYFVAGICMGGLLGILLSCIVLGPSSIKGLVIGTIGTLLNSSSSYGAISIKNRFWVGLKSGIQNTGIYEIGIFFFVLILLGLLKIFVRKGEMVSFEKRMECYRIAEGISMIFVAVYVIILTRKLEHVPVLEILVTNCLVICAAAALYLKNKDSRLSTICMGCVLIELILTIGTNNGTTFYVVFMALPMAVTVCALWKCLSYEKGLLKNSCKYVITIALSGMLIAEGYQYYDTFVYRDSPQELLNQEVNIKEYKGIKTSAERAEYLEDLVEILAPYEDCEMIPLGNFAIGHVITDMVPFFTTSWPDLASFGIGFFQQELTQKVEKGIYPVVVLADVDQTGEYQDMGRVELVLDMIEQSEKYEVVHEDKYYRVYVPIDVKKDN